MEFIGEAVLKVVSIGLKPHDFFETKFEKIQQSIYEFINLATNKKLTLHPRANERITGYTNLIIAAVCAICVFSLLFVRTKGLYNSIRKALMAFFYQVLAIGAVIGFSVHALYIPPATLEGLWYCLYVVLILALMLRFLQAFWECSFITCVLMTPPLAIGAYLDVIACWYFDKFLFIGVFIIAFGFLMGLTHFIFVCSRSGSYFLYVLADLIGLFSALVQVTSIRYGDWDKNGFFHLGVSLYVIVNTFAFIVCLKSDSKSNEKRKSD